MNKHDLEKEMVETMMDPTADEAEKTAALGRYVNQLSTDISMVLTPLSDFSATFAVAILELYAENIRKDFKCSESVIEMVKKSNDKKITMIVPPKESGGEE